MIKHEHQHISYQLLPVDFRLNPAQLKGLAICSRLAPATEQADDATVRDVSNPNVVEWHFKCSFQLTMQDGSQVPEVTRFF